MLGFGNYRENFSTLDHSSGSSSRRILKKFQGGIPILVETSRHSLNATLQIVAFICTSTDAEISLDQWFLNFFV